MTVGTLFTLFVIPVFYSLIAAQHQSAPASGAETETALIPAEADA
jgi:multidrug efflux pump